VTALLVLGLVFIGLAVLTWLLTAQEPESFPRLRTLGVFSAGLGIAIVAAWGLVVLV
jgi:hypothetical protein